MARGEGSMLTQRGRDLLLIVEDDQNLSEMLCTFLRTKQYRLLTTPMGEDVLDICHKEHPNLVLLDINLPDIDGYEVCRRLRGNLSTRNLPILFLTQRKLREDRIAGLNVGADDYITKPFDVEELYLRVRNALRKAEHCSYIDPVSGLPGTPLAEAQLKTLLHREGWAILAVGVENWDPFIKSYRHLKDKFATYVAGLVRQAVDQVGDLEDFVGRVGTVEFIIITTPSRVLRLWARIESLFTRAMNPPCTGAKTKPVTADLYLSFGMVTAQDGPYSDVRSLAEEIARSRRASRHRDKMNIAAK
jgi:CheY-like chemotaxis protein